jgi:hypothetical protein
MEGPGGRERAARRDGADRTRGTRGSRRRCQAAAAGRAPASLNFPGLTLTPLRVPGSSSPGLLTLDAA